jgi:WD40 repeat protein
MWSAPAPLGRTENLEISADGRLLAAGDRAATFHLYDAASGQVQDSYSFDGDRKGKQIFTWPWFSPDGHLVAAVAGNYTQQLDDIEWPVKLLAADTLEPVTPQPVQPSWTGHLWTNSATFSANGRYLATSMHSDAFEDRAFGLVWDLRAPERLPRKVPFPGDNQGIALSPDGSTIYTSWPLTAFDVATGRIKWQRSELLAEFGDITINTRGTQVTVQQVWNPVNGGATVAVDAGTGKTIRTLPSQSDSTHSFTVSADDKLVATAEQGGDVVVWDTPSATPRHRLETSEVPWASAFSPDGQTLYTAGSEGVLRAYDLAGRRRFLQQTQTVPARTYLEVLSSDDGHRTAYLWRDANGAWTSFADNSTGIATAPTKLDITLEAGARSRAAWHPDGGRLAVHDGASIMTIDARTGKVLEWHENQNVLSISYVGGGERLITGSPEGIIFFDELLWPEGRYAFWAADCCTATAPDGRTAMLFEHSLGGAGEHWRIVSTERGALVSEGDVPVDLNRATYSPDGRLVAGIGVSGQIVVIDVHSGQVRRAPAISHTDEGLSVRFSPDSSRLVSGARDGTVSLWDVRTLDLLGTVSVDPADNAVGAVPSFSGGNDIVSIAAYDGRTYRWDTRIEHAVATACAMAGRNLTAEEWSQAFGDRPYEKTCP